MSHSLKIVLTGMLFLSNVAYADQKLALIIGNSQYDSAMGALQNNKSVAFLHSACSGQPAQINSCQHNSGFSNVLTSLKATWRQLVEAVTVNTSEVQSPPASPWANEDDTCACMEQKSQAAETAYWNRIKNGNNSADYQAYLNKYPNGLFIEEAQVKAQAKPVKMTQAQIKNQQLMTNGLWHDSKTNLVWMRCSLGQAWNGKTCTGEAKTFTWQEALDAAKIFNNQGGFGGYSDWIVPHIEDLSTLRYCSTGFENITEIPAKAGATKKVDKWCKSKGCTYTPTINQQIFPKTDRTRYWSSSSTNYSSYKWYVDFSSGYDNDNPRAYKGNLRLVRSSQ